MTKKPLSSVWTDATKQMAALSLDVTEGKEVLGVLAHDEKHDVLAWDERADVGARMFPRALSIHRDGQPDVYVPLHEGRRYTFGRADNAEIMFSDQSVSRLHGMLRYEGGHWSYFDLGSSNASFLFRARDYEPCRKTDADLPCRKLQTRETARLRVGDGVLLGTHRAWIELLAGIPREAELDVASGTQVSSAAREFERKIETASRNNLPIFLLGPSGSGKTFAAQQIHSRSRLPGNFEAINCARLPRDVSSLHSELLGHVKGAFTGADATRIGRFQNAHRGTLFLDEVESLPELAQGFLLDILEKTGQFLPLGAQPTTKRRPETPPTFRLISASKHRLRESGLRSDLCERLASGLMWRLPTLKERREDIPGLIHLFLDEIKKQRGVEAAFTKSAVAFAKAADWPGEIRELESTVWVLVATGEAKRTGGGRKRAEKIIVTEKEVRQHLEERRVAFGADEEEPSESRETRSGSAWAAHGQDRASSVARERARDGARPVNPRALTADDLARALEATGGNKSQAAERLGIARNTLVSKMKAFGLPPPGRTAHAER